MIDLQGIESFIESNFNLTSNIPDGPTYILKDGRYLDLGEDGAHIGVDDVLYQNNLIDYDPYSYAGDLILVDRFNAIRCSDGKIIQGEPYIQLPKNLPTTQQFDSLKDWLYSLGNTTVYINENVYNLSETLPEEVIKKIKRFYSSGTLYESMSNEIENIIGQRYLYHATFLPYLKSIAENGLRCGNTRNYDISKDFIYLSKDYDDAYSYAELSETVPEEYLDNIVVLQIDVRQLDINKLDIDENQVYDYDDEVDVEDPTTWVDFQYSGKISTKAIVNLDSLLKGNLKEAYLDPEEKFWDYRTKDISGDSYIDKNRSEIRWVDDLLENPKYYAEVKGIVGAIIEITPNQYFEECAKLFDSTVEIQKRQIKNDKDILENLKQVILKYKRRFPIPYIDIYHRNQEGRHRMYVLGELLGWDKKFPVLIIQDIDNIRVNQNLLHLNT